MDKSDNRNGTEGLGSCNRSGSSLFVFPLSNDDIARLERPKGDLVLNPTADPSFRWSVCANFLDFNYGCSGHCGGVVIALASKANSLWEPRFESWQCRFFFKSLNVFFNDSLLEIVCLRHFDEMVWWCGGGVVVWRCGGSVSA
jgi:hypothetical protein